MNTRILRMTHRSTIGGICRRVEGIGQLQPTLFCIERGGVSFRAESAAERHGRAQPCWVVYPLPRYRQEAKRLFAELERCKVAGINTPAKAAWLAGKVA